MSKYPLQNLYPCAIEPKEHNYWMLGQLGLSEGTYIKCSGFISFAPTIVPRTRMAKFLVVSHIDGFDADCSYRLRLVYSANDGRYYELLSPEDPIKPLERDKFVFDIPLGHLDRKGWFSCCLYFYLTSPIPDGEDRFNAVEEGIENPCHPILMKGAFIEVIR